MKVLLYLAVIFGITAFLFISHYITSYYTYTIVSDMKNKNYVVNFFTSGWPYWFWVISAVFSVTSIAISSVYLIKSKGVIDLSRSGSLDWFWFTMVGLALVTPLYQFGGVLINLSHKISLTYFGAAYPSVIINLILIVGIVVYNMYRIVGEKPNKYVWATLIFAIATAISATLSVNKYIK
ncbi:MAG: hypothetical protein Q8R55_02685 [Candidatus Taylorbacteria bacterium]|nr:hypothetical protein [Candidatus Taylorbacteria bacterium]